MFIEKITKKWRKCDYTPHGVEGSVLFIGKGENTISIDLETEQKDWARSIRVAQDYSGTLTLENASKTAALIDIPPARWQLVETGELNEKDEPIKIMEKIPVDVDNCTLTLFPLDYPLEKEAGSTANNAVM